jgi:hypothetical protein
MLLLAFASCTTTQVARLPNINEPNIASIATLQLAVGTATVAEPGGTSEIGLNLVATFRLPGGNDATLQNTPLLIGPMNFITNGTKSNPQTVSGVLPTELAALANSFKNPPDALQEFGALVGVFGYGLAGDNTVSPTIYQKVYKNSCPDIGGRVADISNGPGGQTAPGYNSPRSQELALPAFAHPTIGCGLIGNFTGRPTTTDYYGGPPAWPSPAGYGQPTFFRGYPLGFADFASAPVAGTYQLYVTFTTANDYSTWATVSTKANLPSSTVTNPLPVFPQPTLHVQNDGSGLIDVTVPPGISEAVINVNAQDCLLASSRPNNHYSLLTRATGHQTLFLSNRLGPPDQNGVPTHTFCTLADVAAAQAVSPPGTVFPTTGRYALTAVGFDYPAYEASYPQSTTAAPEITTGDGHNGTADVTTSDPVLARYTFGTGV